MFYGIMFFKISNNCFLDIACTEKLLFCDDNDINCILLGDNKNISESEILKIKYGPFSDKELCAVKTKNIYFNFKYNLIKLGFGFEEEKDCGGASNYLKELSYRETGVQLENRFLGFKTIEIKNSISDIIFTGATADLTAMQTFEYSHKFNVEIDQKIFIGIDLINTSNFYSSDRVKFLNLVSAIEVLKKDITKSTNIINLLSKFELINEFDESLTQEEKAKIKGGLDNLRKESIGVCCGKLIEEYIPTNIYCNMTANKFLKKCYKIRSKISHGNTLSDNSVKTYLPELRKMAIDLYDSYIEKNNIKIT